jgi:hypothetical protein
MQALRVLTKAQARLGREITNDEIHGGKLADILQDSDYEISNVSTNRSK